MKLTKPLCFFDIEGTGLDTAKDRIISIAICKVTPAGEPYTTYKFERLVNPGQPINNSDIHGITDEMVKDAPQFHDVASAIHAFIAGHDLAGYNLRNYDVPILYEEFFRCGITWDLTGINILDVGAIFKKKEERTLTAAVKFYCGHSISDAHNAMGDVLSTMEVHLGQMVRYPDIHDMTVTQQAEYSKMDQRVDLAGKIVLDKDGDASYAIGKSKGVKVKDDPSFAQWMLRQDFGQETKTVIRRLLDEIYNGGQKEIF